MRGFMFLSMQNEFCCHLVGVKSVFNDASCTSNFH